MNTLSPSIRVVHKTESIDLKLLTQKEPSIVYISLKLEFQFPGIYVPSLYMKSCKIICCFPSHQSIFFFFFFFMIHLRLLWFMFFHLFVFFCNISVCINSFTSIFTEEGKCFRHWTLFLVSYCITSVLIQIFLFFIKAKEMKLRSLNNNLILREKNASLNQTQTQTQLFILTIYCKVYEVLRVKFSWLQWAVYS